MATVQSIIDRCVFVTKDTSYARFTLEEMVAYVNDAITLMSSMAPRCASQYVLLTLAAGSRQSLRTIDPAKRWVRLLELVCNGADGTTIRQVARPILDNAFRTWRGTDRAIEVEEFAMDEREVFSFDVFPPVVAGTTVLALAAVAPPPVEDEDSDFPLADGFDIPAVDYVLYRLFCKDANDQSYMARSTGHLQAFNLAMGVETKDAAA